VFQVALGEVSHHEDLILSNQYDFSFHNLRASRNVTLS
jgi:hypothetical protein